MVVAHVATMSKIAGWSGELQDLQDETVRLLDTIRAESGSHQRQSHTQEEVTGQRRVARRHRKKRRVRRTLGQSVGLQVAQRDPSGPHPVKLSYTLDTPEWPGRSGDAHESTSRMGKATVEVLDREQETPRSARRCDPQYGKGPHDEDRSQLFGNRASHIREPATGEKTAAVPADGLDESRFRCLTFNAEEGRVRSRVDAYVPDPGASMGKQLQRLRAERDRLAVIEEEQRAACRGVKRQEFLRFARRKWLASDEAAECVQRVFRGYIGRRRAKLVAEVQRITGEARTEWIEVRDHERGDAWYFNPITGMSRWDRPACLLGMITPSEKVRSLPALASPSKRRCSSLTRVGAENVESGSTPPTSDARQGLAPCVPTASRPHSSWGSPGATAGLPLTPSRTSSGKNAANLPPLMRGTRHSLLCSDPALVGVAPTSGPGDGSDGAPGAANDGRREPQQAWTEGEEEAFPFLTEGEVLPDDRFEETGLGLARRPEEDVGSTSSEDSNEDGKGTKDFFLADGTPNIRLRRTIAKALRVTKFDSVSTLLADCADRQTRSPPPTGEGADSYPPRRAATATSRVDSRSSRKRNRSHTAGGGVRSEGGAGVTFGGPLPYPAGKLDDDRPPSLFGSSMKGGGRKMVSVMFPSKRKRPVRRVKTAAAKTRDIAPTGLATRDLAQPGFSAPATEPSASPARIGDAGPEQPSGTASDPAIDPGGETGKVDRGRKPPGTGETVKEICFNCWSRGTGQSCALHTSAKVDAQSKAGEARKAESALMCKNWDIGVMRRRYRSQELQEIFAKEASSLKYDKERKKFVSVVEQRHLVYRLLARIIAGYNFTVRRRLHQRNWFRALVEQLRMGKLPGISVDEVKRTSKILRLRNTLQNSSQVRTYTGTIKSTQPKPPVTGSTLAERSGLVRVLVDRPSTVMGRATRCVFDGPTPVAEALYEARRYQLTPARTMPMPDPEYLDTAMDQLGHDNPESAFGAEDSYGSSQRPRAGAWVIAFCKATARDILHLATTNVEVMSPVPGADEVARTKYPRPMTIKFATFSRKPTPGMLAVGGLPAEMVVHMLVSTRTPPQYGNFTVMQKSSIAPNISREETAEYQSLDLRVENQVFLPRALQHPLNERKAPTVIIKTLMADPNDRHYFGTNRPDQTGEAGSHGFRTSAHADAAPALATLDPTAFSPSEDVVTPNLCSANRTVTTHADRSYPFCEPSNRSNTTLDFYHLLLTATCSPNKEQVFTNLGVQECGEFMRGSDPLRPLGHCIGIVYRSWAFLQRQALEEFETDDGVPYWFDRRTGDTFWERPLCEEEKVPVKEGGTVLGGAGEPPDSSSGAFEEVKPRYDQQQMRKLMMKTYEDQEDLERRRKQVATQIKWARSSGALPPPDLVDLETSQRDASIDEQLEGDELSADTTAAFGSGSHPRAGRSSDDNDSRDKHRTSPRIDRRERPEAPEPVQDERRAERSRGVRCTDGSDHHALHAGGRSKADCLAASIAEALKNTVLNEGRPVEPSDMLRFGMGLGITLGANGLLTDLDKGCGAKALDHAESTSQLGEISLAPPVVKTAHNGHPIGHGYAEPIADKEESKVLDHQSEAKYLESVVRNSAVLKTSEEFKGLLVVPPPEPSSCPDEDYGLVKPEDLEADPRRKAELSTPIVAYPETLWKKQYRGHRAAGEGESWLPAGGDRACNQRAQSSLGAPMRRTNEPLPEGFLSAISHTHVGKQHCDYLPHVPNMPQARAVGRVRPRSAAEDWFAVGFDPWSAGREPLSAEFIPTLSIKQEDLGTDEDGGAKGFVPQAGYLELNDSVGHAEMAVVSAEEAKMAADFEQISSWARHGRYADVETAMNQADWTMPIDYQNDLGVTLLHVAAQNGNKRIAKLCLRRGADVNKRNNNGQTALHYAYSYGFESFGEYLISKGADDSITNADGLTCYEGLNHANIGQL